MVNDVIGERLIVAAPTPIRADESIDFDAFATMVASDARRGVEGVYLGGSSGEGLLLSEAERMQLARTAVTAADGAIPVFAHIGTMSTREAIALATDAAEAGVAAISMIPPLYYKYSTPEVVAHFRAVIDAVELPFLLYNIPQFTGRELTDGGFEELLELDQVVGVKHTSNNLFGAERLISRYPNVSLINGFDELYLPALSIGARGAIGTTIGIQIELFRSLRNRFANGDFVGARTVQTRINDTVERMVAEGVFGAAKYLASKLSVEIGNCRRPLPGLDDAGRGRLDQAWELLLENIAITAQEDAQK